MSRGNSRTRVARSFFRENGAPRLSHSHARTFHSRMAHTSPTHPRYSARHTDVAPNPRRPNGSRRHFTVANESRRAETAGGFKCHVRARSRPLEHWRAAPNSVHRQPRPTSAGVPRRRRSPARADPRRHEAPRPSAATCGSTPDDTPASTSGRDGTRSVGPRRAGDLEGEAEMIQARGSDIGPRGHFAMPGATVHPEATH